MNQLADPAVMLSDLGPRVSEMSSIGAPTADRRLAVGW